MDIYYVSGDARYCYTTRPNDMGKYPSHCYEVGITDINADETTLDKLNEIECIKVDADGNNYIKIANSKFPIPMFDKNGKEIEPCKLPNGIPIVLAVSIKHNDKFDKDYLVCLGIKLLDDYKPFNPFEQ